MADDLASQILSLRLQLRYLRLQHVALGKHKEYLITNFPGDYEINIYCADLTEDLTGDIGTIEIPGEPVDFNVQPGYSGGAGYSASRDGQLWPAIAGSGDWSFFNQCILPGWQKYKPTYRHGTIIDGSIDFQNDTCSVCISAAFSSQQNLNVNEDSAIEGCPDAEPGGFAQFCSDNPSHPICTNTEYPTPLNVGNTLWEKIKDINLDVNSSHGYKADSSGWREGENWEILGTGEPGDCEDFALTKMDDLYDYGVPIKHLQMATCYVEQGLGYHAVLMIQTQNRGILVLDNRFDAVMTKESLEVLGYNFDVYQQAGHDWATFSTRLTDVPIEYMNCNSSAFADGDEVLIKFEGQSWNSPKVIGFKSEPQECTAYVSMCAGQYFFTVMHAEYDIEADSWAVRTDPKHAYAHYDHRYAAALAYGGYGWLIGGVMIKTATPLRWIAQKKAQRYDRNGDVWAWIDDLTGNARGQCGGFVVGTRGYIAGGCEYPHQDEDDGPFQDDVYSDVDCLYFPGLSWSAKSSFAQRWDAEGVKCGDGKGYVFGGGSGNYWNSETPATVTNSAYRYDDSGDSWISKNTFSGPRDAHAVFEAAGKAYVCGGRMRESFFAGDEYGQSFGHDVYFTKNCQEYDHAGNSWSIKGNLGTVQFQHYGCKNGALGKGFSSDPSGVAQNSYLDIYDPDTGTFSQSKFLGNTSGYNGVLFST